MGRFRSFLLARCCVVTPRRQVNYTVQAVNCDLLFYVDDTGLIFQRKDINIIEHELNINFPNICVWFVDNKLSIHFGDVKTKQNPFFLPL